jgi:hypothetical protein
MHSLLTALGEGGPNRNSAHGLQSARHQKRPLTAVPLAFIAITYQTIE